MHAMDMSCLREACRITMYMEGEHNESVFEECGMSALQVVYCDGMDEKKSTDME